MNQHVDLSVQLTENGPVAKISSKDRDRRKSQGKWIYLSNLVLAAASSPNEIQRKLHLRRNLNTAIIIKTPTSYNHDINLLVYLRFDDVNFY